MIEIKDFGKPLDYATVTAALQRLCPEIEFDEAGRMGWTTPNIEIRASVKYQGRYIAAIDRGMIPEFKVWKETIGAQEITMAEAQTQDDTGVLYAEILPTDPGYHQALVMAQRGDDNYRQDPDGGKLWKYTPYRFAKVRGAIVRFGWRHTLERIVRAEIPGLTREAIGRALGVDLMKYPNPSDLPAAIGE